MKALPVCQPFASLIIFRDKRIENRRWYTDYRGPLVIHAGKSTSFLRELTDEDLAAEGLPPARLLPMGVLLGVVDLVGCVPFEKVAGQAWAEGPWCWQCENPRPIKPVSWKGALGLFDVPDAVIQMGVAA